MRRTIVVGDVHGCIEELRALVTKIGPQTGDRFVFLGDLVDKGPDSLGVVRYVAELLLQFPGSKCIAGNHEEKALRLIAKGTPAEDEPWMKDATPSDVAFLTSLPLVHKWDGFVAVHGGFFPKFFADHPEGIGEVPEKWHRGGGKRMDRMRRFLRVRTVSPAGEMLALGEEGADSRQWAEVYDGREGFAFYGHEPFDEVREDRHAMGIDTSCVFGGKLTAAVITTGTLTAAGKSELATDIELVQVPALKKYKDRRTDFGGARD